MDESKIIEWPILKGMPFFVKEKPPTGTEEFATITQNTKTKWYKLTPKTSILATVFELNTASKKGARRIIAIRPAP